MNNHSSPAQFRTNHLCFNLVFCPPFHQVDSSAVDRKVIKSYRSQFLVSVTVATIGASLLHGVCSYIWGGRKLEVCADWGYSLPPLQAHVELAAPVPVVSVRAEPKETVCVSVHYLHQGICEAEI